jgi:hypothetical protein
MWFGGSGDIIDIWMGSQGAAFAALLAALVRQSNGFYTLEFNEPFQLEKPHLYPPFLIDGQSPHPPLCVLLVFSPHSDLLFLLFNSFFLSTQQVLCVRIRVQTSRSARDNPHVTLLLDTDAACSR